MKSVQHAFQFAVERLGSSPVRRNRVPMRHFQGPLSGEGTIAEAALAIGGLALLKGDHLKQDITITGTLEADGPDRTGVQGGRKNDSGGARRDITSCWSHAVSSTRPRQ